MLRVPLYCLPDSLDVDFVQSPRNLIFRVVLIIQKVSKEERDICSDRLPTIREGTFLKSVI